MRALVTRGTPLCVMTHLKRSIVNVVTEDNCVSHALIIAVVRLTNDPN